MPQTTYSKVFAATVRARLRPDGLLSRRLIVRSLNASHACSVNMTGIARIIKTCLTL
jgi:hypothetical protein